MRRRARFPFSLSYALGLALAVPIAFPAPAFAQQPTSPRGVEAGAHFKRGVELYGEADFTNALIEFRRAYEIDPRFQGLYNIGETYFQLQDYANALQTLEKYLRDGGPQVPPARRDEVQKEIEKLRTRVASLEVVVSVPDADVAVDDVVVGKAPLSAPLVVSAGRRKITVTKANRPPATQVIELAGGDSKRITVTLAEEGAAPVGPVAPVPPPEAPSGKVPVAPWVVTGVLAAGAIVTGSLAMVSYSATKSDLAVYPKADPNAISSDHSKTFALGVTTDVLIGAAAIAAGISIYFTVAATSQRDKPRAALVSPLQASSNPAARPTLRITAGPESVLVRGTF